MTTRKPNFKLSAKDRLGLMDEKIQKSKGIKYIKVVEHLFDFGKKMLNAEEKTVIWN